MNPIKKGLQKAVAYYAARGYPLQPVTRIIRGPLRWLYHSSPVLRHDNKPYFKPWLLKNLHNLFVRSIPQDFTIYQSQLKFRSFGSEMSLHAYYVGEVEHHLLTFLLSKLERNFVMIDVGAHHGVFSLVAALELEKRNLNGIIHAFEPNPENFSLLEFNVMQNGLERRVVLHQAAVGEDVRASGLRVNTGDNSDNVLSDSVFSDGNSPLIPVQVLTLDSMLTNLPRVTVLKIDVQGKETAVLKGAEKLIQRDRPVIFVEAVQEWESTLELEKFLNNFNYSIFGVTKKGELCPPRSKEAFVSWDWVAISK